MTTGTTDRAVLEAFADLLAYPRGDLAAAARECLSLAGGEGPAAAGLRTFAAWAARARPGEAEEVYSATFDLDPICVPYVGHHICPDPARRNLFLSALAAVYAGEGFQPREDLADHVAEVLRFLAVARDRDVRHDLAGEGLVPALSAMKASFTSGDNPYQTLIEALLAFVAPRARKRAGGASGEARP